MQGSFLLTEMQCGNNGDIYRGNSDTIEDISAENLLKKIREKYIPNDDIKLNVTDEEIQKWLKNVKAKIDTLDYDDQKYLCVAIVNTDGGYDAYELEHIIEDE